MSMPREIVCTACGADTLVKREPTYEGFKKVGETFVCVSCGHAFASEAEVPFKGRKTLNIFSKADLGPKVDVFAGDEKGRICRYCGHYVVNPFIQRCGRHHREVQATDTCSDFAVKEPEKKPPAKPKRELPF